DRKASAIDRRKRIRTVPVGQRHVLDGQAYTRKQRQLDLALDGERTLVPIEDNFLELAFIGVGVERQEEYCDTNQRNDDHHDETEQHPFQPNFHFQPLKPRANPKPHAAFGMLTHDDGTIGEPAPPFYARNRKKLPGLAAGTGFYYYGQYRN